MTTTTCLEDKKLIEQCLRVNTDLHIYSIGDLDDFFWPYTSWFGFEINNELKEIVLLYDGLEIPTLLAFTENSSTMIDLLKSISDTLPAEFYAHLSTGVEAFFQGTHKLDSHGKHYKMALKDLTKIKNKDFSQVTRLSTSDLTCILKLYEESYPGNWFDQRMLETNQYFGIQENNQLVSIAGIHVYSDQYKVAALGNITTHPDYRDRGYGTLVTAKLCQSLSNHIDHIGLNVNADNLTAIACYERLGFEIMASFEEFKLTRTSL